MVAGDFVGTGFAESRTVGTEAGVAGTGGGLVQVGWFSESRPAVR